MIFIAGFLSIDIQVFVPVVNDTVSVASVVNDSVSGASVLNGVQYRDDAVPLEEVRYFLDCFY